MEYPGSKFTRGYRLAMLAIFVGVFVLIAPILILYTEGYRYDWQNGLLKESGDLSVDEILPASVKIFLNGLIVKNGLPLRLINVAPGNYRLVLTSEGFYDWQKEVVISSKQTTYLKDINLLKKSEPKLIDLGSIGSVSISPDGNSVAYQKLSASGGQIWLVGADGQNRSLATTTAAGANLSWSVDGNFFAITRGSPPFKSVLIAARDNPGALIDLASLAGGNIRKFFWRQSGGEALFFSASNSIYIYQPELNQSRVLAEDNFHDWYIAGGELWTLNYSTSGSHYRLVRDQLGFASLSFALPAAGATAGDFPRLSAVAGNTAILQINPNQYKIINQVGQWSVSAENFSLTPFDRWLFWNNYEAFLTEASGEPRLVNRSAESILSLLPLDASYTLVLAKPGSLTAIFPFYGVTQPLWRGKIDTIDSNPDARLLFWGGKIGSQSGLWKLSY